MIEFPWVKDIMIAVIDYQAGNIRSITNGLEAVGAKSMLVDDPESLSLADGLILPGVGSFGDAMEKLGGFRQSLIDEVSSGKPFLGVCLGIQLLFDSSEESPETEGLGLLRGKCERFRGSQKVPHMGWNTLDVKREGGLLEGIDEGDYFYFVHSYHVVPNSLDVIAAETNYSTKFPSVITKDNIYATQFHPEKSGEKGLRILKNFIKIVKS